MLATAAEGPTLLDFLPAGIAVAALLLTAGSFWWLNLRPGHLVATAPTTYAGHFTLSEPHHMTLPLVLRNTGAAAIVVEDLRLTIDEGKGRELAWENVRSGIRVDQHPVIDHAAPFVVPGRGAVRIFAEFTGPWWVTTDETPTYPLRVEAQTGGQWLPLLALSWSLPDDPHVYRARRLRPS